jgi:MFS family permease
MSYVSHNAYVNYKGTCILTPYQGYTITQLPSNAILPMVRPSIYIPLVTCAWGLMSMAQGFLHTYPSIMVVRFFIGILEGPFLPGVMFLLSCWYKKEELVKRIAFLYGMSHRRTIYIILKC